MENLLEHTCFLPKDKNISLLELVLNNCDFSLQENFYKQLQGAAVGFPLPSVISNIYMENFEEIVLGPLKHIPTPWWKRYLDDIISIVK